ncbi:glycoside hydrolase family 43 protein [Pseudoduganella namucuonensis]|uniref:Beta-xylosidase n=1 Tax=Pseudoduganella namucuonensis TaxID=1035707 RepID=A0A1I7H6V6_9BURK|nr:glycoside hydrolase 43 family protein [Pseudoduganella namucuonensis]SFU56389.1 Beta-xylosidase [Pseudoduganella namucuonensis]
MATLNQRPTRPGAKTALGLLLPLALAACQSLDRAPASATAAPAAGPWVADLGDGRYRNPILHADYADPDAIRVGDTYYMTSSSFNQTPGLPLLESKDLVNWELVGHALPALVPAERYAVPQFAKGVWAPCLRHHDGKFWIFYPDPDLGVFVMTAERFAGPWSAPRLLLAGKGIIDPAPLWDDDGKAYLMHGWAGSRAGINNMLTLRAMSPDATRMLDERGPFVIDGHKLPGVHTLEGPKLYKADGYYYVFAPAGGVEQGYQMVFRSRSIDGPYESRTVLVQGDTAVNGPHQGAWVRAQDGGDWFLHFQDKKTYGRIVHLQPMRWRDGWPVIGEDSRLPGAGQPVSTHKKPVAGFPVKTQPAGDEFDQPRLGLQWQWNANSKPDWYSLAARPGMLRLHTQAVPEAKDFVRNSPAILSQKLPAPVFMADTRIELANAAEGDRAGLIVNAIQYAWIGLRKTATATQLVYTQCGPFRQFGPPCTEETRVVLASAPSALYLRVGIADGGMATFSYSTDNAVFTPVAPAYQIGKGGWVGAQVGLFSVGDRAGNPASHLDVDYFRMTAP